MHVPTSHFPKKQIEHLIKLILSEWGQEISNNQLGMTHCPCLSLNQTIEPKFIINHSHPNKIRDPHSGFASYYNQKISCDYCA